MAVSDALAATIPAEMGERRQWVAWDLKQRPGDPKPTKVPRGSVANPKSWMSYTLAAGLVSKYGASGVGFVFTDDDPYLAVDLDDCRDAETGELHPAAAEILDQLGGYQEPSPSGNGMHAIVRGELPDWSGNRGTGPWGGSLEIYARARFLTMTGRGTGEIANRAGEIEQLAHKYLPPKQLERDFDWDRIPAEGEFPATDEEVIATLREDPRFVSLWEGRTVPPGKDGDSKADFEVCVRIAEVVGDHPRRIERLWGESALGKREKWNREDYRRTTIQRAIVAALEERWDTGVQTVASRESLIERAIAEQGGGGPYPTRLGCPTAHDGIDDYTVGGHKDPTDTPPPCEDESSDVAPIGRTARDLRDSPRGQIDWLIPGVAARGWTVLLAGREKTSGKGTLGAYLISRLERGEATVFGKASEQPATALIFTEEPWDSLAEKHEAFDITRAFVVFQWELGALSWEKKIEWLVSTAVEQGHGLIYIDNISRAAGVSSEDENGIGLARAIGPLSNAAKKHNITVIIDHHTRKSGGKTEDLIRGGTALPGAAENIIVIERVGEWESRRRKLSSRGRVKATLWQKTIELTEDGTDYELKDDFRLRILDERDEWTAAGYAEATGKSLRTARRFLNDCKYVAGAEAAAGGNGGGQKATVYRVKHQELRVALLALDPEQPGI